MSGKIIKTYEIGRDSNFVMLGAFIYESDKPSSPFSTDRKTEPCLKVWIQFRHCAGNLPRTFDISVSVNIIEAFLLNHLTSYLDRKKKDEGEQEYPQHAAQVERLDELNREDAEALKSFIEGSRSKQPELFGAEKCH